jgi:hypothetical protein
MVYSVLEGLVKKCRGKEDAREGIVHYIKKNEYSRSIPRSMLFIFSFASMLIAKASFSSFVCREIGDRNVLLADMSISCDWNDARYPYLAAWSIFGVCQVVVVPLLFIPFIYIGRFHKGGWSVPAQDTFVSFLYGSYVDKAWWMECLRIEKKVLIVLISKFVPRSGLQLMYTEILLVCLIMLMASYQPYVSTTANRLELVAHAVLATCLAIASAYFVGDYAVTDEANVCAQIVIALLSTVLFLYTAIIIVYMCREARALQDEDAAGKSAKKNSSAPKAPDEVIPTSLAVRTSTLFDAGENAGDVEMQDYLNSLPVVPTPGTSSDWPEAPAPVDELIDDDRLSRSVSLMVADARSIAFDPEEMDIQEQWQQEQQEQRLQKQQQGSSSTLDLR